MPRKGQKSLVGSVQSQKAVVAQVAHIYDTAPWVPTEREIAAEVVKELENRRALYNDYELEVPDWVVGSVTEMRKYFHEKLVRTREEGALSNHLRSMRAACRKFLDTAHDASGRVIIENGFPGGPASVTFFAALGELRSSIGLSLALLMAAYSLSCEPDLARILPANPDDGRA
jgi:hypothetical protein